MKFTLLVLCFAFFSFAEGASQNQKFILKTTTTKDGFKKLGIDLNQDSKVDRIETYKKDQLVSVERDSTYKGKFDETITYFPYLSPIKPIEIIKKDTNLDGKVDRIENVYRDPAHDLLIITTKVDSKFNGIFDRKWTTTSKLSVKKDEIVCLNPLNIADYSIFKLKNDVDSVKNTLDNGFYITDWGYKIHQSCLEKWGANTFPSLLKNAMTKGFQCLAKLGKDNLTKNPQMPNGAYENLRGLELLLQTTGVSIVCNERDYDWSGTLAHASTSVGETIKESGVRHPFISLNETDPKLKSKPTVKETDELSGTLFHEQLHNLGIRHNESVEFPYACETCCIEKEDGEKTADACRICSGAYAGPTDKKYLTDLIKWGRSSSQSERAAKSIINFQKEFPKDRFGLFAYADASSGIFEPVGIELGKILKQKFSDLTPDEENFLKSSQEYSDVENLIETSKYSKLVAESHFSLVL